MKVNLFKASLAQDLTAGGAETEIFLDKITTATGETITTSQFATLGRGILTVDPDANGIDRIPEFISFTTVNSSNLSVTGAVRGISALNNDASTDRAYYHPVGTKVVISVGVHDLLDILDYVDDAVAAAVVGGNLANIATGGEIVAAGNWVYLKDDGKWWKTDASTAATAEAVQLGIAQGAGVADGTIANGVIRPGSIDTNQSGLVAGTDYYLSDTAGEISASAGTVPKYVGRARSTTSIYFDPNYKYIPTDNEKDAMAGTGTPSSSNKYVTEDGVEAFPNTITRQVFTSSGTWTKPAGLLYAEVEVVGRGGNGASPTPGGNSGGGGGGGGGYAKKLLATSVLGATETVTIGATCSFTVNGGSTVSASTGSNGSSQVGGNAGIGSNGDINIEGQDGGVGGSGGINVSGEGGNGGSSHLGGGGTGGRWSTTSGSDGNVYGGGGGGGASEDSGGSGTTSGGAGAGGVVMVTEYKYVA